MNKIQIQKHQLLSDDQVVQHPMAPCTAGQTLIHTYMQR